MVTTENRMTAKLLSLACVFLLFFGLTTTAKNLHPNIRPQILRIADKLQKDNQVHFGYPVGFSGKLEINNKYYKLYKRLQAKATTEELVEFTNSKSALIIVYAFNILQSRNYNGLKSIFLNHVNDTMWYWTAGGCTGFLNRVNWFMLQRLKPVDNAATSTLTKTEYDLYCSRFKKEDELFSCY